MTSKRQAQHYLRDEQYKNGVNLGARTALHNRFSVNPQPWHTWVFEQFDLPSNTRLLELGAGLGKLWESNLQRIPKGWQIILSDFSDGMVAEQRQRLGNTPNAFGFETVDAQDIPYEDDTFDSVIANHMLYHVPDLPKALSEIRRVLKPDGKFYAATNGFQHCGCWMNSSGITMPPMKFWWMDSISRWRMVRHS